MKTVIFCLVLLLLLCGFVFGYSAYLSARLQVQLEWARALSSEDSLPNEAQVQALQDGFFRLRTRLLFAVEQEELLAAEHALAQMRLCAALGARIEYEQARVSLLLALEELCVQQRLTLRTLL